MPGPLLFYLLLAPPPDRLGAALEGAADLEGGLLRCWYWGLLWLYCWERSAPLLRELYSLFRLLEPVDGLACEGLLKVLDERSDGVGRAAG